MIHPNIQKHNFLMGVFAVFYELCLKQVSCLRDVMAVNFTMARWTTKIDKTFQCEVS